MLPFGEHVNAELEDFCLRFSNDPDEMADETDICTLKIKDFRKKMGI